VAWIFGYATLALALFGRRFGLLSGQAGLWVAAGLVAGLLVCMTVLPLRELWMRRRFRRDREFSDRPPGVEEFAVEIVVKRRGKALGADRGVVWFDQGRLGFSGERTSFLLAREDLILPEKNAISWVDVPYLPLLLNVQGGKAEVVVRPLWGQGRGYRRSLMRFLKAAEPVAGERQWPPLVPYSVRVIGE
jgi:hypothetical protein